MKRLLAVLTIGLVLAAVSGRAEAQITHDFIERYARVQILNPASASDLVELSEASWDFGTFDKDLSTNLGATSGLARQQTTAGLVDDILTVSGSQAVGLSREDAGDLTQGFAGTRSLVSFSLVSAGTYELTVQAATGSAALLVESVDQEEYLLSVSSPVAGATYTGQLPGPGAYRIFVQTEVQRNLADPYDVGASLDFSLVVRSGSALAHEAVLWEKVKSLFR